jgi:hypothetical protein
MILIFLSTYLEIIFIVEYYYIIMADISKFVQLIIELMLFYISLWI